MKTTSTIQLQTGDVLGMIASHLSKKYGKKVIKITPIFKDQTVFDNGQISNFAENSVEKTLSHFEVSLEEEISDTFGD